MVRAGVEFVSLTDHETVAGLDRFRAALVGEQVRCVTGAEIQVLSDWGHLHILAYGFDDHNPTLRRVLRRLRSPLFAHAHELGGRLWAHLTRRRAGRSNYHAGEDTNPSASGRLGDHHESPFVGPARDQIGPAAAFSLIHRAGGRAFLAHPLTGDSGPWLAEMLPRLRAEGLDGIEALYKPYSSETQQLLHDLAERNELLVSGGSDYHGRSFPGGDGPGIDIPDADLRRFLGAVGQTR